MNTYTTKPITDSGISDWDALVDRSENGTVFHYHWWLNATGVPFTILGVYNQQGALVGGIPLTYARRYGLKLVRNPALTPFLGPIFATDGNATSYKSTSMMRDSGSVLANSIRGLDSFSQQIGMRGPDLQGFLWRGFAANLHYTYRIECCDAPSTLLSRMHSSHRSKLLKLQRRGTRVVESHDVELFLSLNRKSFRRNGLELPYSDTLVHSLWEESHRRGHATMLLARNSTGTATDGIIVFSDAKTAYLVLVGGDPAFRGEYGGHAIIWEAIQRAHASGQDFDFEGSSIPNIELFYRRWGGKPCPTIHLSKTFSNKARLARFAKTCLARA